MFALIGIGCLPIRLVKRLDREDFSVEPMGEAGMEGRARVANAAHTGGEVCGEYARTQRRI